MKDSLSPTNAVELTAFSPQEAQTQLMDSDLGKLIIAEIQKESLQPQRRKTSGDEKHIPTDEPIKSQEELNSSFSVRKLSPSIPSSVGMPSLIEEDALLTFLSSLGITAEDLEHLDIPEEPLRQLFQQETACSSALKWSRFEQIVDNTLHGLLLSRSDLQLENKKTCLSARVRPHEHSVLLRRRSGLRKAYAVSELVDGIRLGVFGFVQTFIVVMLLYRLGAWASSGQRDFSAFEAIFSSNNQKGIDSLTGLLAKLNPSILRFILTTPLILGGAQSLLEFATANQDNQEEIIRRIDILGAYFPRTPSWWHDFIRESIPIVSRFISVSEQIQQLEQSLNWNGQLTPESRLNAFSMIRQIAQRGRKIPQWTAMDSLARLAQGISFKDFPLLQAVGYDKVVLAQLLFIKAHALADLVLLLQKDPEESAFKTAPRRLYASYLLWWLGQVHFLVAAAVAFFLVKNKSFNIGNLFFL